MVDRLSEEDKGKIDVWLSDKTSGNDAFVGEDGKLAGYFSCKAAPVRLGAYHRVELAINSFGKTPNRKVYDFLETRDRDRAESMATAIDQYMRQKGFRHIDQPFDEAALKKEIFARIKEAAREKPSLVNPAGGYHGICSGGNPVVPNTKNMGFRLLYELHSLDEVERAPQEYVPPAVRIAIPTSSQEPEFARFMHDVGRAYLSTLGFPSKSMDNKADPTRPIDPKRIDPDTIIHENPASSRSRFIVLVNGTKEYPEIRFSTGSSDPAIADRMVDALRDYLHDCLRQGTPITIEGAKSFLNENGLSTDPVPIGKHTRTVSDIRDIAASDGAMRVRLFTPGLHRPGKKDWQVVLKASPYTDPYTIAKPPNANAASCSVINTAIQDRGKANRIKTHLLNIAETLMTDYFAAPDRRFITEPRTKAYMGGKYDFPMIKEQKSPDITLAIAVKNLHYALSHHTPPSKEQPLESILYHELQSLRLNNIPDIAVFLSALTELLTRLQQGKSIQSHSADPFQEAMQRGFVHFIRQHPEYRPVTTDPASIRLEHDTEHFPDWKTFNETVLRPGIEDMARKLSFRVDAFPIGDDSEQYGVSVQPVRDFDEALPDERMSAWVKPLIFIAPSKETAHQFTLDINHALFEDPLFGRLRPVTMFGDPSTEAVLRESLCHALRKNELVAGTGPDHNIARRFVELANKQPHK